MKIPLCLSGDERKCRRHHGAAGLSGSAVCAGVWPGGCTAGWSQDARAEPAGRAGGCYNTARPAGKHATRLGAHTERPGACEQCAGSVRGQRRPRPGHGAASPHQLSGLSLAQVLRTQPLPLILLIYRIFRLVGLRQEKIDGSVELLDIKPLQEMSLPGYDFPAKYSPGLGVPILDHFLNPRISWLLEDNPGIPGLIPRFRFIRFSLITLNNNLDFIVIKLI